MYIQTVAGRCSWFMHHTKCRGSKKFLLILIFAANCFTIFTILFNSYNITSYQQNITSFTRVQKYMTKLDMKQTGNTNGNIKMDSGSPFIDTKFHMNLSSNARKHIILHWNSPSWLTDWSKSVDMSWCQYKNCYLSYDRTLFNQSSAVVFNLPHHDLGDKPPADPDKRNPNQVWIFFTLESPENIRKQEITNPYWQKVFNWSWTYKPHSDIFHPYGALISNKQSGNRNYSEIFRKKTKFAAWAVSHCYTPNKREQFAEILKKYIDLDIFGQCGTRAPPDLEGYLNDHYKFYLGFENSFCDDYMTEKFFHYLPLDVITVVRGFNNYTAYLPKQTFIDTANFSSITALAKFMKDLGENEEEYIKYLKEKDKYSVFEREFMYKEALCTACEKLNDLQKYRRVYDDVVSWLGPCHHDITDLKEDPSMFGYFNINASILQTQN